MSSYSILIGITIIILIIDVPIIHCQDWNPPYFLPPNVTGINFDHVSGTIQFIQVTEEIHWPFKLAIINYNGNDPKPTIGEFYVGNTILLNASIVYEENKWYVQINNRQDYENENQRIYSFDINIGKINSITISIRLQNIFDNPPSITYDGPCKAEELKSNYLTNCTFHVTDVDGMEGNNITFKIIGQHEEDKFLKLQKGDIVNQYKTDYNLFIINELHYEERNSYNFMIYVYDIEYNSGNMSAILEVIDMPNMDPVWVKPFVTANFKEKTPQNFTVAAIDGDTGINKPINYRLEFYENENYENLMNINQTSGLLHINSIDRDALQQEIFQFKICAYKYDNTSWSICDPPAAFIIEDINDNWPEISLRPKSVSFFENTFLTIPLNEFIVNDIDLGIHATYNVSLSQSGNILYSEAFDIIPDAGYQKSDFRITVHNASLLDYEDSNWRKFDLIIVSQELNISTHRKEEILGIELINWNDELPIFEKDIYEVNVSEIVGINYVVGRVIATDRDIGDSVIYEIIGATEGLSIDKINGTIMTTLNRTFDHERQTSVIVQIRANDTLIAIPEKDKIHSTYTQLSINVIDVNDKTPELRMPRKTPNITENSPGDTLITDMIIATDPDTTALLKYQIDWSNSYATKSGQETNESDYKNCFYIERKPETRNKVYGLLKVNPDFVKYKEVDYEKFDTIYLTIRVTDENQEVGEASAEGILTVRIDDVNDNRPMFILNTLNENRSIAEEAENGRIIGTINAIDIDGPPFNIFNYSISPSVHGIPETPPYLIEINNETGVITVKNGKAIDCDYPRREYLYYEITLSDGIPPNTKGEIKISITDINNKKPQIEYFENPVKIWEKSPDGTHIGIIYASDLDRDYPHNALQYSIDFKLFPDLKNFFEIDTQSGEINVKLFGGAILDRDLGEPKHVIHVNVDDNYMGNGIVNSNKTSLTVILMDVNDHAPEMPDPKKFLPVIKENAKNDTKIIDIEAKDIDEPNTPNSWVSYKILDIRPEHDQSNDIQNYENLFRIECVDNKTGQIFVNKELKGFYGTWLVQIEAHDHGEEGPSKIRMSSNETYIFTVTPYNFHNPEIIYPKSDDVIRLSYRGQQIGLPLLTVDGQELKSFEAYDPDGGNCGNVTFKISSYSASDDSSNFKIYKESRKHSSLRIAKEIQARIYRINLIAEDEADINDGGKKSSNEIKNLIIAFIDMNSEPYFENNEFNTKFSENDEGLQEKVIIPEAIDPKNEGTQNDYEKVKVYYFIDPKYHSDDAKLFSLDKNTRILKVNQKLNSTKERMHKIRIIVTNKLNIPNVIQNENSILMVNVKVMGPPIFDEKIYGAGITTSDYASKLIRTIHATSSTDNIKYSWNTNDIITKGENIENVKTKMFNLDSKTGKISLQQPPTAIMKGYFQFNVTAIDDDNRTDITNVKIYIITEANRVKFIFYNEYEYVVNNTEYLENSLNSIYGYDMCNIDEITKSNNNDNNIEKSQKEEQVATTTVRVHFIKNNEAIDASEILSKSSDISLIEKLKRKLNERTLYLNDVPQEKTDPTNKIQNLQTIIFGTLSAILFIACITLTIVFILRIKAKNRQLKAFTTPDLNGNTKTLNYSNDERKKSIESINHDKIFTIEKTNPILKNDNKFNKNITDTDAISLCSNESDFMGIQGDPIFMTDDYLNDINPKIFSRRINLENIAKDEDA